MSYYKIMHRHKKKLLVLVSNLVVLMYFILINRAQSGSNLGSNFGFLFSSNDPLRVQLWPNQSREQIGSCRLPRLELAGHENVEKYVECRMKHEWGYLSGGRWHLNRTVASSIVDPIECKYRNLTRVDDFKLVYSEYEKLIDGQLIPNEVIEVDCVTTNAVLKLKYNNILVHIVDKLDEVTSTATNVDDLYSGKNSNDDDNDDDDDVDDENQCKPLNILLISYDSLSRVSWFKRLHKSTNYMLETMKFKLLYGFNIMGDGTPACMIPLLTGKAEHELPSTLKSDPNGQYVDQVYPFIWHELHKKGYMSFHMEDWPQVSAFTYRLRGMSNRTAHHYMRAYQLGLWNRVSGAYFSRMDDFCVGSMKRHKKALNLIDEFIDTYTTTTTKRRAKNHIAIMHYIENSHDGNDRANYIDDDLKSFLHQGFLKGKFNRTAILLYSDHGSRFSVERLTKQGDLEERMPFFSIYLPDAYIRQHPDKYTNLANNAQQLVTAFDIHATLRDLTCLDKTPNESNPLRSMSLLRPIPVNRSCADIGISMHYCICELDWQSLDVRHDFSLRAFKFVLDYINNQLLGVVKNYCRRLDIYKKSKIEYVKTEREQTYLRLKFMTIPNSATYEAVIKVDKDDKFSISSAASISRTNPYGNQPRCLEFIRDRVNLTVDLRKFCQCKNFRKRVF